MADRRSAFARRSLVRRGEGLAVGRPAGALRVGTLRASDGRTVKQVADKWIEEARSGLGRNRSGDAYKPSAIRSYGASLRLRVLPALGERKFSQVRRVDVQGLVDELHKDGLNASTVLCSILP